MHSFNTSRITILAIGGAVALAGCASVPAPLAGDNFTAVTPQQVVSQSASGQRVRWGGEIINVEPRASSTCFEILSRELYADARPNRRDHSDGRFIACKTGFFDPAVYAKGRDVTVVGAVNGNEKHKVGEYDYTFAKVDADEIYMWPKRTYPAGYYDPYWGGCYGDPFWGPAWGRGWNCGWGWGGGYWGRPGIVYVRPAPPPPSK